MTNGTPPDDIRREQITRGGRALIVIWAAGILILYLAAALLGVSRMREYRARAWSRVENLVGSAATELRAAEEQGGSPGAQPIEVHVGAYLHQIRELSITSSSWKADFEIWFRWRGDAVNPGESFQIANGTIESREQQAFYVEADGERYERYRVRARIVTQFDTSRGPFGGGVLGVQIEDATDWADRLQYVVDEEGIGVSPTAANPNMKIEQARNFVSLHRYPSRFGDPRLAEGDSETRSRYVFGVFAHSSGLGIYVSLFQALFVAVAIALIAPFIKPIHVDPRFGLGIGAVFAAVGNNIFAGLAMQSADGITLMQMINGIGLVTIFLTIVQSAVSLYVYDSLGRERLSRIFDRVCFAAFVVGYLTVNIALPLAAGT